MPSRPAVWLFLTLAVLSAGLLCAQTPSWNLFPGAPGGTTPRFDDISFVNERTGYVARATGGIYKTTDAGNTFALVHSSSMTYPGTNLLAHFRSIMFVTDSHGFAGNLGPGSYDSTVRDTNILYESFDGGTNWTRIPGFPEAGMQGLCAMYALDSQHLYGAGRVRGPAYFIKSIDGGTNWTITNLTVAGVMGGLMDVYFRDQNNGFVVGMDTNAFNSCAPPYYHGAIARTTNGGASWQVVASDGVNCAYFWKMSWPSANIGYASLQQNGTMVNHIFYKTTDGGATWTSNGVPFSVIGVPSFYSQGIGFVTDNEGWVGGDSGSGTANFMHTVDGGVTWTPVGNNDTLRVNRIRFLRPDYAVASGARVLAWRVPLAITSQPQSTNAVAGTNVTFTVTAQGSSWLNYQWRFNGANLPGATTIIFSINNVQPTNGGNYDVVVGDVSGSVTSATATLTVDLGAVAPSIVVQPQSKSVWEGQSASFTVSANGSFPLSYQWRLNGTNLSAATQTIYARLNAQPGDAGPYAVVVANSFGSITSAVALLTVNAQVVLFKDDFETYSQSNVVTTAPVTTNGYRIFYRAASGTNDFKAIFGFDYSSVTYPTNIPPSPHTIGGTTKGLYLTVNKDATAAAAAVNLYPTNRFFSNNFALKFDLWINWRDINTSTEHALFGINHSGNVTNRIGVGPSDGLFFAMEGEDDSLPTSTVLRDYSVFRGAGASMPFLMITNNTTFGPAPLLSTQFENYDPGFVSLFPSQTIPGFGTTPQGTAGLKWLSGEVRQNNNLITWLLNETIIAQFTNIYAYSNGNIMIGYNDNFSSTGDSNNFAIFDNIRVESIVPLPVVILSPRLQGNSFGFSFTTEPYESYTVEWATNLPASVWMTYTNFLGSGGTVDVQVPLLPVAKQFYRVRRP